MLMAYNYGGGISFHKVHIPAPSVGINYSVIKQVFYPNILSRSLM